MSTCVAQEWVRDLRWRQAMAGKSHVLLTEMFEPVRLDNMLSGVHACDVRASYRVFVLLTWADAFTQMGI